MQSQEKLLGGFLARCEETEARRVTDDHVFPFEEGGSDE